MARDFDQSYWRFYPKEVSLDGGIGLCQDSTFVLYCVDGARRHSTVCASSNSTIAWSYPRYTTRPAMALHEDVFAFVTPKNILTQIGSEKS